jgi:hypothetical protein
MVKVMPSEFITRVNNIDNEYEVIFKTDNKEDYKYIEDCCREVIDHLKQDETIRNCSNCRYSDIRYDNRLYCIGVKEPEVTNPTHSCKDWKYRYGKKFL